MKKACREGEGSEREKERKWRDTLCRSGKEGNVSVENMGEEDDVVHIKRG